MGRGDKTLFKRHATDPYRTVWEQLLSGCPPTDVAAELRQRGASRHTRAALRFAVKAGDGGPIDLTAQEVLRSLLEGRQPSFSESELNGLATEIRLYGLPLPEAFALLRSRSPELARLEEELQTGPPVEPSWPDLGDQDFGAGPGIASDPRLDLAGRMNTTRQLLGPIIGPQADTDDLLLRSRIAVQVAARYLAEPPI
jgi:hypothetical protein